MRAGDLRVLPECRRMPLALLDRKLDHVPDDLGELRCYRR
jgi:hypothetical protein